MESISVVTITERELENHLSRDTAKIFSFSFRAPKKDPEPAAQATLRGGSSRIDRSRVPTARGVARRRRRVPPGRPHPRITPEDDLYTDVGAPRAAVLRRGMQVFLQIHQDSNRRRGSTD